MVKITNGLVTFEVTSGAFKNIYSHQGFTKVDEKKAEKVEEQSTTTEEQSFSDRLTEKPIAQWSNDEVKRFAEENSIDITGTKSAKEAKARIKEFLAQK